MNAAPPVPRACQPHELATLIEAASGVFRRGAATDAMGRAYPLLFSPDNVARLRVIGEMGSVGATGAMGATRATGASETSVLSHAGYVLLTASSLGRAMTVACFGAVFTDPAVRGQGFGTAVFADAVRCARAEGAQIGLVSGRRPLYARCGFVPTAPMVRWRVRAASGPEGTTDNPQRGFELVEAGGGDVDALAALQAGEPVRFRRSRGDWQRLLASETLFHGAGVVCLLRRDDVPVASVAVEQTPRPFEDGALTARALELAGDRAELAVVLPHLAFRLGLAALDVYGDQNDHTMARAAASRGWATDLVDLPFAQACWDPQVADAPVPLYGLNYV